MRLVTYLGLVLAGILILIAGYGHAGAMPKFHMRVLKAGPHNEMVGMLAINDNGNGTSTLVLDVCGTTAAFTSKNEDLGGDEFVNFTMDYIRKICEQGQ